jgi:alpha-tubulin suppressor-like RCC1 family protein
MRGGCEDSRYAKSLVFTWKLTVLLLVASPLACTSARSTHVDDAGGDLASDHGAATGGHDGSNKDGTATDRTASDGTASDGSASDGSSSCAAGTHNCSGLGCVDDNSSAHCGGMCSPCLAPDGGTVVCADGGVCDFECGGTLKKCVGKCVSGCCLDSDCPQQNGMTGQCDTSTNTCSYLNCANGFKPCGTACISTDKCCVAKDCATCMSCSSAGACVAVTNQDDPVANRCAGTCDGTGVCRSKRGQACNTVPVVGTTGGCVGTTMCSPDGYCCNSACNQSCLACDLQGYEGTCTPVASGGSHSNHPACAGSGTTCAGTCGGNADGSCVYNAKACGSTCSGTSAVTQSTCNAGTCQAATTPKTCAGKLICSAGACETSCSTHADCVSGYFCDGGSCHRAAKAVAAGGEHTCALLTDGTIWCWGDNMYGELGNGTFTTTGGVASPTQVQGLPGPATAVVSGSGGFSCALINDGTVYCWGANGLGELGNGTITATDSGGIATPGGVSLPDPATSIACGDDHVCALVDHNTYCWGFGAYGVLGDGVLDSMPSGIASPVEGNYFSSVTGLWAGTEDTCAVATGVLYCWGYNAFGQLGDGSRDSNVVGIPTPQKVSLTSPPAILTVGIGDAAGCLLFSGGKVDCWGAASPSGSLAPVSVDGLTSVTALGSGADHFCTVDGAGDVSCWGGENMEGELGNGTTVPSSTPVSVVGLPAPAVGVSLGGNHSCVVLNDGSVWCWGADDAGQLGNSVLNPYPTPTPVQVVGW